MVEEHTVVLTFSMIKAHQKCAKCIALKPIWAKNRLLWLLNKFVTISNVADLEMLFCEWNTFCQGWNTSGEVSLYNAQGG